MQLPDTTSYQPDNPNLMLLLDEFFTSHADDLFYFCYRRIGNVDYAQDACSRIVLKALKALDSFVPNPENPGATFRAWVYRIARNDLIDHQRAYKPTQSLDRLDTEGNRIHDPADPVAGPEEIILAREADQRLTYLLQSLPDSQRAIVELRLAGLSGDEIAQTLGLTLSAVKSAQYRAYQRLRDLLLTTQSEQRWAP